jgi:hypothetical protein
MALVLLGLPSCLPVTGALLLARTPAPVQKIVVQVSRTRVTVDGREMTRGDQELKRAITRPGCNELVLRGDAQSDEAMLVKIVRLAPRAQICKLWLDVDDVQLDVPLSVYVTAANRPEKTLVAVTNVERSELWSVDNDGGGFERLGSWPPGDSASETTARDRVKDLCGTRRCSFTLEIDARVGFMASLRAWQRVLGAQGRTAHLGIRASETPDHAPADTSGTLAPSLIQAIVRASFETFRRCYQKGLARDPELKGIVRARFVINTQGKVKQVANRKSTLPDSEVTLCVLQSFYRLRFPPPEGGTVTVVYPIHLAPGP